MFRFSESSFVPPCWRINENRIRSETLSQRLGFSDAVFIRQHKAVSPIRFVYMLRYDNPYPDNRDSISGEYTPISYNEVKRMRAEGKRMAQEANSNKQMFNMLQSIMK